MNPPPTSSVNSFLRFLAGFVGFITLSFVITYTVNSISISEEHAQQAAAAHAVLMGEQK